MRLHYSKRLDVFPRPEPFVVEGTGEVNPVEGGGKEGAIGYFEGNDIYKDLVVEFIQCRLDQIGKDEGRRIEVLFIPGGRIESGLRIIPSSLDGSLQEGTKEELRIDYLTPMIFSDLITSPTVELALQSGSKIEQRWSTTNDKSFLHLLSPSSLMTVNSNNELNWRSRLLDKIRHRQFEWGLSFSPSYAPSRTTRVPSNPLTSSSPSFRLIKTIFLQFFIVRLGYWIFILTGARFVVGMETWMEWTRWEDSKRKGEKAEKGVVRFGSVLHSSASA